MAAAKLDVLDCLEELQLGNADGAVYSYRVSVVLLHIVV